MSLPLSYKELTTKQRIYVDSQLSGMTKVASAAAAGSKRYEPFEKSETVRQALVDMMQRGAEEVGFSRKDAHDMYMQAYQNADTAMEQIAAVNAMVKLHGLEKPQKLEIKHEHTHSGQIEHLPTEELMKLAGMQKTLTLEGEFSEVEEKPVLTAPEVTDDNTIDNEDMPELSSGYRA
jgi:hypothetical protein